MKFKLFLLVTLFLGGCSQVTTQKVSQVAESYSQETLSTIEEMCEKISIPMDNSKKNACFEDLAIKSENFNYCKKVERNESNNCYYEVSRLKGDKNICDALAVEYSINSQMTSMCYMGLAVHHKDFSYCDNIKDVYGNEIKCYKKVAEKVGDEKACENINEDFRKYACYIGLAINKKDYKICDKTSDEKSHSYSDIALSGIYGCYRDVALASNDVSVCDAKPSELCYEALATKNFDYRYCDKTENDLDKGIYSMMRRCYNASLSLEYNPFIGSALDLAACDSINPEVEKIIPNIKNNCYEVVALKMNRDDLCKSGQCIHLLAEKLGDEKLCSKIDSEYDSGNPMKDEAYRKDYCERNAQSKIENIKVCSNYDGDIKKMCLEYIK